jgi:hypothetical protein
MAYYSYSFKWREAHGRKTSLYLIQKSSHDYFLSVLPLWEISESYNFLRVYALVHKLQLTVFSMGDFGVSLGLISYKGINILYIK